MNENWNLPHNALPSDELTSLMIAEQYGMSRDHVNLLLRRGKVRYRRPGREYLVLRSDWEEYENSKNPWGAPRGPRKKKRNQRKSKN